MFLVSLKAVYSKLKKSIATVQRVSALLLRESYFCESLMLGESRGAFLYVHYRETTIKRVWSPFWLAVVASLSQN